MEMSFNQLIKIIIVAIVIFFVGSFIVNFGEETGSSLKGFGTSVDCIQNQELCEKDSLSESLSEKELDTLQDVIKKNDLNPSIVASIIKIESANNRNAIRFECSIYNNQLSRYCTKFPLTSKVSCSNSGDDTSSIAFEKAYQENKERAICMTSFGLFQVMGFNYGDLKYSIEDFYETSQTLEGQLEIFDRYVNTRVGLKDELQKENPNFQKIAEIYNGADYKKGNYDEKLEAAYKEYS
jgi:hypothetical protein